MTTSAILSHSSEYLGTDEDSAGDGRRTRAEVVDISSVDHEDVVFDVEEATPTNGYANASPTNKSVVNVKAVENQLVGEYQRDFFACLNLTMRHPVPLGQMQSLPEI